MIRIKCIDLNTTTMNIKKVFVGVSLIMSAMAGHSQSAFQVKQQSLPTTSLTLFSLFQAIAR